MSYSPLEIYKAVIKEFDNKEVRIFCLEIWSNSNLIHTIDLASLELHGEPCTDGSNLAIIGIIKLCILFS